MNAFLETFKEEFSAADTAIFQKKWPSWIAGVLLAVCAILIFLWNVPWGIAAGYRNWGDWLLYFILPGQGRPELTPWLHKLSVTNFGLFAGAMASAMMSRQFKLRTAPGFEYAKGVLGGVLMGIGAALAGGCNVGGFYSAIGVFSMGGYAMMIGLGIGALIGLKLLLWEMEYLPPKARPADPIPAGKKKRDWTPAQRIAGAMIFIAGIAGCYLYGAAGETQIGGLLFFGLLIGLVMHRSRFCFVRAFREPFMTGESEMVKAVALSLVLYGCGSAVIKWNYIQPPEMGVFHPFWMGSLIGGMVFGIGMLLAGGCASSTLWRSGEGHTKLMTTLVAFAVTNSAAQSFIDTYGIKGLLGHARLMPDMVTWYLTLPVFIAVLLLWVIAADWNQKTEKLVIF